MAGYLSVAEARRRGGLRLVLTAGVPGPWGEAAKGLFHVKGIPYARVRQEAAGANQELVAWTGHANAPVAVYADERPRAAWSEIVGLAERLAPTPALVPREPSARAWMFGLIREIAGEQGLGWSRRLMMLHQTLVRPLPDDHPVRQTLETLAGRYGYSAERAAAAPERAAGILRLLAGQLARQRAEGRRFLVGDALTALDVYWAAFAALLEPLPPDLCPMPEPMRASYTLTDPVVRDALDPALLAHRDAIYRDYLELPIRF